MCSSQWDAQLRTTLCLRCQELGLLRSGQRRSQLNGHLCNACYEVACGIHGWVPDPEGVQADTVAAEEQPAVHEDSESSFPESYRQGLEKQNQAIDLEEITRVEAGVATSELLAYEIDPDAVAQEESELADDEALQDAYFEFCLEERVFDIHSSESEAEDKGAASSRTAPVLVENDDDQPREGPTPAPSEGWPDSTPHALIVAAEEAADPTLAVEQARIKAVLEPIQDTYPCERCGEVYRYEEDFHTCKFCNVRCCKPCFAAHWMDTSGLCHQQLTSTQLTWAQQALSLHRSKYRYRRVMAEISSAASRVTQERKAVTAMPKLQLLREYDGKENAFSLTS